MEDPWPAPLTSRVNYLFVESLRRLIKTRAAEQALQLTFAKDQEYVPYELCYTTTTFDGHTPPTPELGSVRLVAKQMRNTLRIPVLFFPSILDLTNLLDEADSRTRIENCVQVIVRRLQIAQRELNCPGLLIWVNYKIRDYQLPETVETSLVPIDSNGCPFDSIINA